MEMVVLIKARFRLSLPFSSRINIELYRRVDPCSYQTSHHSCEFHPQLPRLYLFPFLPIEKKSKQPDRTFHNFETSRSGEQGVSCCSKTSVDRFWSSRVVKGSVESLFFFFSSSCSLFLSSSGLVPFFLRCGRLTPGIIPLPQTHNNNNGCRVPTSLIDQPKFVQKRDSPRKEE